MNHQGGNRDTGGADRLFSQQSVVDPCDFSMAQYWQHNQHQFLSHQDVNIQVAHELIPQENDVYPTNALNKHQYMSHNYVVYLGFNIRIINKT